MSYSLRDSLKTKMDYKQDHILVFATNKTLHERFTPKYQRSVFMLNNGYTSSFKNNVVKRRLVFPNKKMIRNDIHSPIKICNMKKNEIETKNELMQLAKKRRTVFMPAKFENKSLVKCTDGKIFPSVSEPKGFDSSTPKRSQTFEKFNFLGDQYNGWNETPNYSPFSLSSQNSYFRPSLFNWNRKRISKAQLDDEIDEYMADVKLKSTPISNEEDNAAFIQEYFMETEKFLQENEFFNYPFSE